MADVLKMTETDITDNLTIDDLKSIIIADPNRC
jgi:hypothetical protein